MVMNISIIIKRGEKKMVKEKAQREMLTIFHEDMEQGLYHEKRLCDCLDVGWLTLGRDCKNFFEVFGTPATFNYIREDRTEMEIVKDYLKEEEVSE